MKTFFNIITGFFFFLSIVVGLFLLRGEMLLSIQAFKIIKMILLPGYLILAGIMVGNLVANIWSKRESDETKIYTKSFIIGIIIGVVLALTYMII